MTYNIIKVYLPSATSQCESKIAKYLDFTTSTAVW